MSELNSRTGNGKAASTRKVRARSWSRPKGMLVLAVFLLIVGFLFPLYFIPFQADWIGLLSIALIFVGVLLLVANRLFLKRKISSVGIDKRGLLITTFGRGKLHITWEEMSSVKICDKYIEIRTPDKYAKVSARFARFPIVVNTLRRVCEEKKIKCFG